MAGKRQNRARNKKKVASVSSASQAGPIAKPLSYPSVKCVMEYLEPNKRFEVYRRIPSLRSTENLFPLRIKELKFENNSVTINHVTYSLGIYREFKKSASDDDESGIPHSIKSDNNLRGTPYDTDEYGDRDITFDEVLSPGDISFLEYRRVKMTRQVAERELKEITDMLKTRHGHLNLYYRDKAYFLKHFLENRPLPFENFLQFTVERGEKKKIRRIPYDSMKIHEAFKILTNTFFHHDTILVDRLSISSNLTVLRLPPNLKLHVKTVFIDNYVDRVLPRVLPMIAESSLPLDFLEIGVKPNSLFRRIKNDFKTLIIPGHYDYHDRDYERFPKSTHLAARQAFSVVNLLRHWLGFHKDVGTRLTIGYKNHETAMKTLENLKKKKAEEFNFVVRKTNFLSLRVDEQSTINITVEGNLTPIQGQQWIVKFEVVPSESV